MPRQEGQPQYSGLSKEGSLFPDQTGILLEPNPEAKLNAGGLNPVVVFCGVNGTGKDYLAAKLHESGFQAQIVGFGDMLSSALKIEKSALGYLRPGELETYYPQIVEEALKNPPTLLTAHPVFKQGGTLCFNPGIYTAMDPVAFVVITSEEKQVNEWRLEREQSDGRPANCEDEREIRLMQNVTQAILHSFALSNGAGLITVRNTVEDLNDNVSFLNDSLKKWFKDYCEIEI